MAGEASGGVAPVQIPRLLREALYAPDAPTEAVAALVEVALTHHNSHRHDQAIAAYNRAEEAWLDALVAEAIEEAGLTTFAAEVREKPWLRTGEEDPAVVALREAAQRQRRLQLRAKLRAAKADARQADGQGARQPQQGEQEGEEDDEEEDADGSSGDEDGADSRPFESVADRLERERNLHRLQSVTQSRDTLLPAPHRIFLHLAKGSVYSSAQNDTEALAEFGAARKVLLTSVPVHATTLLSATVHSMLGSVYYHLSQYDIAGDCFFRCLEARESLCGADHVDTAVAVNNVGAVLYMLGRSADSLVLFQRAKTVLQAQMTTTTHPRNDLVSINVRIAQGTFFSDATFPAVPFTPYTPPMIPGAARAWRARNAPKAPKKPSAKKAGKQ